MGRIITFYSYKGGVGRSMAIANVGVLLANAGYKTLLIDWDLEAPGLEMYFQKLIHVETARAQLGVINLLQAAYVHSEQNINNSISSIKDAIAAINWKDYLTEIPFNTVKDKLYLMNAGKQDATYPEQVRSFDYKRFYKNYGGDYVEDFRNYLATAYDFVLIDSRTGLTDSSGICSIQLPDVLVILFTPTAQGFEGAMEVAKKAKKGQEDLLFDRLQMKILPVATRLDDYEEKQLNEWTNRIAAGIEPVISDWMPDRETVNRFAFIELIKIPYKSSFSYGEKLAVLEQGTTDPKGIGFSYLLLAALLANYLEGVADFMALDKRGSYIKNALTKEKNTGQLPEINKHKLDEEQELQLKEKKKKKNLYTAYIGIIATAIAAVIVIYLFNQRVGTTDKQNEQTAVQCGDKTVYRYKYPDEVFPTLINSYTSYFQLASGLLTRLQDVYSHPDSTDLSDITRNNTLKLADTLNQDDIFFETNLKAYFISLNNDPCNDSLRYLYTNYITDMANKTTLMQRFINQITQPASTLPDSTAHKQQVIAVINMSTKKINTSNEYNAADTTQAVLTNNAIKINAEILDFLKLYTRRLSPVQY